MKKIIILLIIVIGFFKITISQWQSDVRLTNNSANSYTSFSYAKCLAVVGDTLHCVWYDDRDGSNYEIYYKRSSNNGLSWQQDTRLTNDPSFSHYPSICAMGSNIYVVWQDKRDGNWEVYYKNSTNTGLSWGSDINITNDTSISNRPTITTNGTNLYLVWMDYRNGNFEIYCKISTNAGVSWGSSIRLTNNTEISLNPTVGASGLSIHVAWCDERDGNPEIYYKQSSNGGVNWSSDVRLTNNAANSEEVSISVLNSNVYIVWDENASEIYFKSSNDNGLNWSSSVQLSNNSGNSSAPDISAFNSQIHVVWGDNSFGNYEIFYETSSDMGNNWGSETRLTNSPDVSSNPSVAVFGTYVHLIWSDRRDGNPEIYYKQNPTGNIVYVHNSNSEIPKIYELEQNYPNPFNPETKINYTLKNATNVKMTVYDRLGREVVVLVDESQSEGEHSVTFNAANLPSGVYFYRIKTNEYVEVKKMVFTK